jgi:hypothetical protein
MKDTTCHLFSTSPLAGGGDSSKIEAVVEKQNRDKIFIKLWTKTTNRRK